MEFSSKRTNIDDIIIIKTKRLEDNRGLFIKGFEKEPFSYFLSEPFAEDYVSQSKKNALRGLHYQIEPKAQGKLITVLAGRILDVALDLRNNSPSLFKFSINELSSQEWDSIWIPKGFAHGFLSLEEGSTVLSRCTTEFDANSERGIRWNDPLVNIPWPISDPILSDKDRRWKLLEM